MGITVNTSPQQITASVGETKIDVSVSGGVGPTGAAGPPGTTSWSGLTNVPSSFTPSAHAASHSATGSDPVTVTVAQVTGLQTALDGKQTSGTYATLVGGKVPAEQLPPIASSWSDLTNKPTTVSGFGITDAVVTSDARLSDAREWSADTVTQAEAEAGTSTTRRAFTAQRVFQAIAAWWATITVGTSKIADGAVTAAKIASGQSVVFSLVTVSRSSGTGLSVFNPGLGTVFSVSATNGQVLSAGNIVCGELQPSTPVAVTRGGTGATTASAARTNLGLGTAATSAATDFAAATHTHTLSSLTQSGATTGQVAQWNGAAWVPATAGGSSVAVLSDTVASTSYIGQAAPGSATSASVWKIRRTVLTSAGAVSSTATATSVKWDDRLTASYS